MKIFIYLFLMPIFSCKEFLWPRILSNTKRQGKEQIERESNAVKVLKDKKVIPNSKTAN